MLQEQYIMLFLFFILSKMAVFRILYTLWCQGPGVIRKLEDIVVNRIAAGEIIQRPANALKELIENSLDAKANFIQVTVKSGGLKLLQIQDNGTGIRKEDLAIVCERFTTSKLTKFEDLTHITTFGFRGEALASISHVAHLSIQTKTSKERCGYKAIYEDGKLQIAPKPCAGNQGTIISIEDLFYNMPQRRQAFKSPAEEFQKIFDVLSKYAVHNAHVAFTLKKYGEQPSVKTPVNSSRIDNIRIIYGNHIAKELLEFQCKDDVYKFEMHGMLTKVNYASKKGIMLLFINQRLVDSAALKSAIDDVYATYLAKGMHPFIYISLTLPAQNIDVNVHPTKHEVHFLYEDEIIEKIKVHVETQLLGSNETRTFYKQLKLPGVKEETQSDECGANETKIYAKDMVRTDAKSQKLDKYFEQVALSQTDSLDTNDESFRVIAARKTKQVRLTSVLEMRQRIENSCNVLIRRIMKELVFVGIIDENYALIQHETKLLLCQTRKFAEELFYQRLVYEFENCVPLKLKPSLSVKELVLLSLNSPDSGWSEADGDKEELATNAVTILQEKAPIMRDYFALHINESGMLETLPTLLPQHVPDVTYLPLYMLRLATEVEWEEEQPCFETFCRETAHYYAQFSAQELHAHSKGHKWMVEHVLYPALKKYLLPPTALEKHIYELTNLPTLYKVFERC